MSMVITLPDEMIRRIEAAAAVRGETVEELALEAIESSPLLVTPIDTTVPVRRRLAFVGAGTSGDSRPSDIHRLRREIAAQATS